MSDLGQLKFKEDEKSENKSTGAIKSALDSLDDSLEKAEKIAIKGISELGSGIASGFSKLFVQKPESAQGNNTLYFIVDIDRIELQKKYLMQE